MRIGFATTNPGKLSEAQAKLGSLGHDVVGLDVTIEEIQAEDLATVARHKAAGIEGQADPPYFVEDAGLFVDALSGFPGVYSAYVHKTVGHEGLVHLLAGVPHARRTARFEAVVAYVDVEGETRTFDGRVEGRIVHEPRGTHGFGFDPVFQPDGYETTFAELTDREKNAVSHRARALDAFATHLADKEKP